jgi:hypothetical protein
VLRYCIIHKEFQRSSIRERGREKQRDCLGMSGERLNLLIGPNVAVKQPWIGEGATLWVRLGGKMVGER